MRRGRRRHGTPTADELAPGPDIAGEWAAGREAVRTVQAVRIALSAAMRDGGPYAVVEAASLMLVLDPSWQDPRPPGAAADPLAQFGFPPMGPG